MNAKQRERILELADLLERLPDENFDMGDWYGHGSALNTEHSEEPRRHTVEESIDCGTACCVACWAAVLFQDAWEEDFGTFSSSPEGSMLEVSRYNFCKFFGLDADESEALCYTARSQQEKAGDLREVSLAHVVSDAT